MGFALVVLPRLNHGVIIQTPWLNQLDIIWEIVSLTVNDLFHSLRRIL